LSKGAILADEVGLGKTIEAGLLIAQRWAERKRRLLIITPANLRKQWHQELADKFGLPAVILEAKPFRQAVKDGTTNPFDRVTDAARSDIVICSYQFAASKANEVQNVAWDLVVVDEAHRLRNVYKPENKTARALRDALSHARKVFLTATPCRTLCWNCTAWSVNHLHGGDQGPRRRQYAGGASQSRRGGTVVCACVRPRGQRRLEALEIPAGAPRRDRGVQAANGLPALPGCAGGA